MPTLWLMSPRRGYLFLQNGQKGGGILWAWMRGCFGVWGLKVEYSRVAANNGSYPAILPL